ncbi:MAG: carboxypeptidase-like regulatory domain-containing protein [Planctomycetota bacterium]
MQASPHARLWTSIAGLLGLALIAGAWLWSKGLERGESQPALPRPTSTDRPATDALADLGLESAERSREGSSADVMFVDGLPIPVGVRLRGDGRLAGRVLERASGRTVARARIDLWAVPPTGNELLGRILDLGGFSASARQRLLPVATEVSGADGSFTFTGVRKGDYFLEARGARHVADAVELVRVVSREADTQIDVWVRGGGRVVGRVERANGTPVANAKVHVFPGPGAVLREAANADLRVCLVTSGRDGTFVVAGVPPGEGYDLAVDAPNAALSHVIGFDVIAGEDTVVTAVVRDGARVRGRVVAQDEDGAATPIVGAHVGVVPRGLRDLHFAQEILERTHAVTAADGSFVLTSVPSGTLDVVAVAAGYRPTLGARVNAVDGLEATTEDVVLEGGPTVRVRVYDGESRPLAGVTASWWVVDWKDFEFEISLSPFLLQGIEGFEYPETDSEGLVTVGPFPNDETQHFALYHPVYGYEPVLWDPNTGPEELEVRMAVPASIEGIVLDADEAVPVTTFTLFTPSRIEPLMGAPAPFNPYSGGLVVEHPTGRFRLDTVRSGQVELRISAPGYLTTELEQMTLAEGEAKRGVIVKLKKGGVVNGRVVDTQGRPVAGAQVQASDAKGQPATAAFGRTPRLAAANGRAEFNQEFGMGMLDVASQLGVLGPGTVLSDADGAFTLNGLPPGSWDLRAKHRDYAGARQANITIAAGETLDDVVVELSAGGTLFGEITDRFDRPVEGAIVLAFAADAFTGAGGPQGPTAFLGSRGLYQGQSNADGRYRIEHLTGGSYFVTVTRGDEQLNPASFLGTLNFDLLSVAWDGETRCDMIDSSMGGVRVHGTITAGGLPVARGGLFAVGFESENMLGIDAKFAEVDAEGRYKFAGLAPGPYRLAYGGGRTDDAGFDVEIPDLPEYRLDLELPSGRIEGVVLLPDGQPIDDVRVKAARLDGRPPSSGLLGSLLSNEGRASWSRTRADGSFAFEGLEPGRYAIDAGSAEQRGGRGEPRRVLGAPAETQVVELGAREVVSGLVFELQPPLTVRGRVTDDSGALVAGARVTAWLTDGLSIAGGSQRTAEDGTFELQGLAPAEYDIGVEAKGYARTGSVLVDLAAGVPPPLELTVERGTELVVFVLNEVGRPMAGATARVEPVEGRAGSAGRQAERVIEGFLRGEGVSGDDGRLELGRFSEGAWRVEVLLGERRGRADVSLTGESAELEVRLESARR